MALALSVLNNDILSFFRDMKDGDNRYFAQKISSAFKKFAESGDIATTDGGGVPGGAFIGAGKGEITVDASVCENIVYAACMKMNDMRTGGNEYLAQELAKGIDSMIGAGQVKTDVTGTITNPSSSYPVSGQAAGTMTGVPAPMESAFLSAFNNMNNMRERGDEYMAQQIADAVDAYLKAATVKTNGNGVISGSVGQGKMT